MPLPGQPGHETWEGDSARGRSGVNVWGFMTVDSERGIAYLPFAAPTWDRYGGDRKGANLFGTSLVAVDALTGKYLWHFQVVHHDIWDNDLQAPPALFDVRKQGRSVPAVAIVSKNGLLFMLDRRTGEPIHPVEERAVPGERRAERADLADSTVSRATAAARSQQFPPRRARDVDAAAARVLRELRREESDALPVGRTCPSATTP